MAAIADCNKAIKNMGSNDGADELQQLMSGRGGHSKLQGTFPRRIGGYGNQLPPSIMVLTVTTIRGNSQYSATIQCNTQCVSVRTPQWNFRLQQDAPGANGM